MPGNIALAHNGPVLQRRAVFTIPKSYFERRAGKPGGGDNAATIAPHAVITVGSVAAS